MSEELQVPERTIQQALAEAAVNSAGLEGPSLAERIRALPPVARLRVVREAVRRSPDAQRLLYCWRLWARQKQLPPPGDWDVWVLLAGRRFGKTRAGAEWVRSRVESGLARSIAIVGPTYQEVRRYMVGGVKRGGSGILDVCPPWDRPTWYKNDGELRWRNGAVAYCLTGEDGEFRGYGLDTLWGDEVPLWRRAEELVANAEMAMSDQNDGAPPQALYTTTTKPTAVLKSIILEPGTVTVVGESEENLRNLSAAWWRKMQRKVAGTVFGEQELRAAWVEAGAGSLWTLDTIDRWRVMRAPALTRVVTAVDPAGGGADPIGIVTSGLGVDGDVYVLAEDTRRCAPEVWGATVVRLVREYGGDVLVERNHYGDLAAANVRAAFRDARSKDASVREPRIIEVQASESKGARAAPISAATTRGQVHHVGRFPRLELEMTTWVPGKGRSPNGVDALCHGATELLGLDDEHPRIDARREVLAAAAATRAFRAAPRSL